MTRPAPPAPDRGPRAVTDLDVGMMLAAALDDAGRNVPIFPTWGVDDAGRCRCPTPGCENPGKHPHRLAPHGFKDATTDPEQLRAWWTADPSANLATHTRWCVVLDVDPKAGGDDTLAALEAAHGPLPETPRVLTGGGGTHYYFARPAGLHVKNSAGKVGPGLDVRGPDGYVLLPPSRHASGRTYREDAGAPLFEMPLAPIPPWLLARMTAAETTNDHPAPGAVDWAARLRGAPKGERHAVTAQMAGHYLGKGHAPDEVAALLTLWSAHCTPPFSPAEARRIVADLAAKDAAKAPAAELDASDYLEPIAVFLAEQDPPVRVVFPDFLPCGVILLLHGEPRARKSLAAFELALAAATGTAPFGLARFTPAAPVNVLYIQEEDPRALTRPRVRRLVRERCGGTPPATLHVAVRRGIDLDDPVWVARIITDCRRLGIRFIVLDAARRLSIKTDEGPAKVRELIAVLRAIVSEADATLAVVHHDIKPAATGQDLRRRGQRASGGDWFAASECPVHVERVGDGETLVYPQDYKFSSDPAPFTFSCLLDGALVKQLVGRDTTTQHAETAGVRGTLLAWVRSNGPASKTAMKKAGFGWETIGAAVDALVRDGLLDAMPGRTAKSQVYFATSSEASAKSQDGSAQDERPGA